MQTFIEHQGILVCFWLLSVILVVSGSNYEDNRTVEVVGLGECADCRQNNIKSSQAYSGLRVTVDCKSPHGHYRTRGTGALDVYGNFKVSLPQDMVENAELKEDCYAQLHSASAEPCPSHGNSKIVTKSISDDNKHTLGPAAGKLRFSSALCTSAFFWHFFKHPNFPYPPKDQDNPPPLPPKKSYPKDPQPPVPVYKKPPSSVYKKPPPIYKKPPTRTPSPVVKKPPCPPKENTPSTPTPVNKPPTPIPDPPPTTPPYFGFFPPFPFKKKPCPPLPRMPPPHYFNYQHPWFGNWPPSRS